MRIRKLSEAFGRQSIEQMSDRVLLGHFKDAVLDRNYNPSGEDYNKSGYTLDRLEQEILSRMTGGGRGRSMMGMPSYYGR